MAERAIIHYRCEGNHSQTGLVAATAQRQETRSGHGDRTAWVRMQELSKVNFIVKKKKFAYTQFLLHNNDMLKTENFYL